MGYPMTYRRVIQRGQLWGGYAAAWELNQKLNRTCDEDIRKTLAWIAGDLRRLEKDQRDDVHLEIYARETGLTVEQVKAVLDLFFEGLH